MGNPKAKAKAKARPRGHVRQRETGAWVAIVPLPKDPATGARKSRWITCGTEKEAQRALSRALAELDAGTYVEPSKILLKDHLDEWIEKVKRHQWSAGTYEGHGSWARTISAKLGHLSLGALDPSTIQGAYSAWLDAGLSARTVAQRHGFLKAALKYAVRWKRIAANPCDDVDPPRIPRVKPAILNAAQAQVLLAAAEGHRIYVPVLLAFTTGMRRGEILALRWMDVDLDLGVITVCRALERTKRHGRREKGPKSEAGYRTITLPKVTAAALVRHRARHAELQLALGPEWNREGYVCCNVLGVPMDESILNADYRALRDRLGLPPVRFHSLRHSHGSLSLALGATLTEVSRRMGHANTQITAATYLHPVTGEAEATPGIMDRIVEAG